MGISCVRSENILIGFSEESFGFLAGRHFLINGLYLQSCTFRILGLQKVGFGFLQMK